MRFGFNVQLVPSDIDGKTNEGTLFAIAFLRNYNASAFPRAILYILNNHPVTAVVEVSLPHRPGLSGYPQTIKIRPKSMHKFLFSTVRGISNIQVEGSGKNNYNKGIRVKSINNVPATVLGSNSAYQSSDTFLALPCQKAPVNDYQYFIFASAGKNKRESQVAVVACEDTRLIFKHRSSTYFLKAFQVLHRYTSNSDLTGSIVISREPLAVFSGHQCGVVGHSRYYSCDHLVEQMPLHVTWGNRFLTAPFGYRTAGEFYRVGSIVSNNYIKVTCTTRSGATSVSHKTMRYTIRRSGGYYQFQTNNAKFNVSYRRDFCSIETSKPAVVMQYMPSSAENQRHVPFIKGRIGDPSMAILPPVKQYRSSLISTTMAGPPEFIHMATWTVPLLNKRGTALKLNGKALYAGHFVPSLQGGSGTYISIRCSNGTVCGYGAFAQVNPNSKTGVYTIEATDEHNQGVNFNVYGHNTKMSYSHSAGFKMLPIGGK